ncbi:hypothetical protein JWZ98_17130 [Methylomonas sp. EFPC1]|uniref:tetratricopeptide repeat protein n=1 Tax=Methylomonas sp. EFPC1 TaxID=2812647 RepID=UPI0019680A84|nr:hypothetical protein [Methylomonas sp. EFPC1]QSB00388.1 hypothetical protein JWZ98_17130 [Methylomonas sp. EFPC1]
MAKVNRFIGSKAVNSGVLLLQLIVVIVGVYLAGKSGPFLADDYPNIIDNQGVVLQRLNAKELAAAWSGNTSGPFKRPLASLSFALNYFYAGQQFDPVPFKLTNIGIHVINSFLVFLLSCQLLKIASPNSPVRKLAFLSALIWAVHPLQLTSVLYVVQRMNSMACMFMLSGFLVFLKGRLQLEKPAGLLFMVLGCVLGTGLGVLSKENALLLPLLIFVSEVTLLPPIPIASRFKVYSYYLVTVILPVLFGLAYLLTHPEYVLGGYLTREFTLAERLMSEARILFYYLGLLFYPDNTQLSLAHDDFVLSKGPFQPFGTVLSITGIVVLIVVAIYNTCQNKTRFLNFAVLWFFVGHAMESTIFPLELIYEHRNYLPSIGIVLALVALLYELLTKQISSRLLNGLYACIIGSLALATHTRAAIWSNLDSFSYFEVRNHPGSVRANSAYANNLELKRGPNAETYQYYLTASKLNIFEVSTLIEMFMELNRLINFQGVAKDQKYAALPTRYDEPLVLDVKYMEALRDLVHKEVLRRISDKSHPLRTMDSIRTAATCLINGDYECKTIAANVLEWSDAALMQPNFTDKPMMHLIKAKVYFTQGQTESTFEEMDRAIALDPNRMYFRAEKAYLFIELKEYDKAEDVIREAELLGVANGFDAKEFQKLRDAIVYKKAIAQTPKAIISPSDIIQHP